MLAHSLTCSLETLGSGLVVCVVFVLVDESKVGEVGWIEGFEVKGRAIHNDQEDEEAEEMRKKKNELLACLR